MKKTIRLRGGDLSRPSSGSAVTIDGKTLEEYIAEEEAKELGEELHPDHLSVYHKSRPRYAEKKEGKGPTRILTRREINAENWEKIMENQKSIEGVIASLLLSGREVRGAEIQNNCMRQLGITKKKYSTRSTYLYHKTDFGKFIESRRDGKGAAYKLVPAALDCKPEELMLFIYKGNDKARETVLEHHKGLRPYLEVDKEKKESKIDKKISDYSDMMDEAKEKLAKVREKDVATALNNSIKPIVPSSLGVNIVVSGKVEVVFRFIK